MNNEAVENKLFVASVGKALSLLEAFGSGDQYLSLSDFAERTNLNKSAVQRFSYTLESIGYLEKDKKTKHYRLTPKSMDVAYSYLRSNPLIEIATPRLVDFRNKFGLTVNLSVRNGTQLIYVVRVLAPDQPYVATLTGRRIDMYCSAGGRMIMSALSNEERIDILNDSCLALKTPYTITDPEEILNIIEEGEKQGFCVNKQEYIVGELVIASVIKNSSGAPIAAVHVPTTLKEWSEEKYVREMSHEVVNLAASIRVL